MATQTKSLKAVDRQAKRDLAKELKKWHKDRDKARSLVEDADQRIDDVTTKQFAHHAKFLESSLAVGVKDFGKFAANKDFYSTDCVYARIATLVRLDNAMGRISLQVAHQLGHDLIQIRTWEIPMGGWKDKVLSLGMEYRRSVRYILIAGVFPRIATLETLGITTVSAALDACQMAKKEGWTRRSKSDKSFDSHSHLDDLRQALAEADVDRSKYDEQHFFPSPEKPQLLESDKSGDSESESTETESKTTESEQSADEETTNNGLTYGHVYEALEVMDKTLIKIGVNDIVWSDIADSEGAARDDLLTLLKHIQDRVSEIIAEVTTGDAAPPIESDTADDVEDASDDSSTDSEVVVAVSDEDGIDHA